MQKLLRYVVVGLAASALNFCIFIGGISLGAHYLVAATVSSTVTLIFSYFLNRSFTFSAAGSANLPEFASFLGVFAVQYLTAMAGYAELIGRLGFSPTIAFLLNNIVIATLTFVLLRNLTFRAAT